MGRDIEAEPQGPLPRADAWRAVGRCVLRSVGLLLRGRVRQPDDEVGRIIRFVDGSEARVYRETRVVTPVSEPCVLFVEFRLRLVRGRGHRLFRWESLLNTPLFVGFPGFVSKLWVAHDGRGRYRGIYEWDGSERAEAYARALWRVLAVVSQTDSIGYHVVRGARRDDVLVGRQMIVVHGDEEEDAWWQVVTTA